MIKHEKSDKKGRQAWSKNEDVRGSHFIRQDSFLRRSSRAPFFLFPEKQVVSLSATPCPISLPSWRRKKKGKHRSQPCLHELDAK